MRILLKIAIGLSGLLLLVSSMAIDQPVGEGIYTTNYPTSLSQYHFFQGPLVDLKPADGVFPYELNAPLFSDYALKKRFIKLPAGHKLHYHPTQVFEFPVGATIIKNFSYPRDAKKPESGQQIIETRLLIREESSWVALPYIWNEEQTEASLEITGGTRTIQWKNEKGKKQKLNYYVPNMVECKSCHSLDKELVPIGPSARQLNYNLKDGTNQLQMWQEKGLLTGLPESAVIPHLANWDHSGDYSLPDRARAYLDVNCGHCHNPKGPANTSGMFLDIHTEDPSQWGVNKPPVAAGRGAGGKSYGIVPGQPEASILVHRMESTDPGVMMPEVGRQLVHAEGVALIKEWIREMGNEK